jgi:hypothetical protein
VRALPGARRRAQARAGLATSPLADRGQARRRLRRVDEGQRAAAVLRHRRVALLSCIAEVNPDKLGCFTPGTGIPIVSEADAIATQPFALLVLPWHFRTNILSRASPIFDRGIEFLFPLPTIELVASA